MTAPDMKTQAKRMFAVLGAVAVLVAGVFLVAHAHFRGAEHGYYKGPCIAYDSDPDVQKAYDHACQAYMSAIAHPEDSPAPGTSP